MPDDRELSHGVKSSAAGPFAGYVVQLRRALFRLAEAYPFDWVGVETLDDVAIVKEALIQYEQNKLTLTHDGNPITDRSRELWRTLDIWTDAYLARENTTYTGSADYCCRAC